MQKYCLSIFILIFCNSISARITAIEFKDSNQRLPSNTIISDEYYDTTGNVFFINRDYQKKYSQIIEYNIKDRKLVKSIFNAEYGYIDEYDIDGNYITWSVKSKKDIYIYYYNITTGLIYNPIVIKRFGNYPLGLNVDNAHIVWLDHNFKTKKTSVKIYNIKDSKSHTIESYEHVESRFKIPVYFLEFKDGKIFYDLVSRNARNIVVYSLKKNQIIQKYKVDKKIELHYSGTLNIDKNTIVLYAKTNRGDKIYKLNLTSGRSTELIRLDFNNNIYEDRVFAQGNSFYYIIQKEISNNIIDNYSLYTYNLSRNRGKEKSLYFNYFKTEKLLGLLKFNDNTESIIFELHE